MRLFFALWPDDATRAAVASAASLLNLRDGRPLARADLHLTLAFVGEVPEERVGELGAMAAALDMPGFDLMLVAAGWWRRSRVAWLAPDVVPIPLQRLAAALRRGAELPVVDAGSFRPHVTVARGVRRPPGLLASFSVPWQVRDFALVSSNSQGPGPHYRCLAQWPLRDAVFD
ncbi:MAG: RNA 2',3'-cyclic phosphodiesterase [Proteobacteria bacterium]|nr:RNA 2',3'-cyclic phosphodiesterase [Pseudomonadota bacterium]